MVALPLVLPGTLSLEGSGTSQGSPLFPCCRSKLPALPHFPLLSTFSRPLQALTPTFPGRGSYRRGLL